MTTRFGSGTPVKGPYGMYTLEQLKVLEDAKNRDYSLGIAHENYVNQVLLPDGSLNTDPSSLVQALTEELGESLSGPATSERLQVALDLAKRIEEVTNHIAMNRFLFVVKPDGTVIYFQCATADNPDLPALATPDDDDHLTEVRDHIATVIADHEKAPA